MLFNSNVNFLFCINTKFSVALNYRRWECLEWKTVEAYRNTSEHCVVKCACRHQNIARCWLVVCNTSNVCIAFYRMDPSHSLFSHFSLELCVCVRFESIMFICSFICWLPLLLKVRLKCHLHNNLFKLGHFDRTCTIFVMLYNLICSSTFNHTHIHKHEYTQTLSYEHIFVHRRTDGLYSYIVKLN